MRGGRGGAGWAGSVRRREPAGPRLAGSGGAGPRPVGPGGAGSRLVAAGRRWGWGRSLVVRLTAVATAVTALALLLLLAGLYVVLTRQLAGAVDDGLHARYADVAAAVSRGEALTASGEQYVELRDVATVQRSPALALAGPLVTGPAAPVGLSDRTLRLAPGRAAVPLRVLVGRTADGRLLAVATSRRPQQQAARQLQLGLGVAGPVLLLFVALVVARSTRAALRPVDALARIAERVSEGHDVARRLPPLRGDDELARLSRTLDAMLGRLEVAFERERAFVDDASHELRTPVTVLRGEIELALSDLADRAGVEQSLRAALAEAERLSRLAEDLLVLARERAGSLAMQDDPLDLRALLERTAGRLRAATRLELEVDSPDLVVTGDASRLEQLLTNLVTNAAQAGAGQVLLAARVAAPDLLLLVEDDGPGFPPGFAGQAFERFSRADEARTRTSGAGLGLALVAAIAAAAGGSVRAGSSARLGGACVQVTLPLRAG